MSLDEQDLAAIGRLMDQKLEAVQAKDRRRRRFWVWFWIVAFVLSSVASWWALDRLIARAQDEVAQINLEFSESKLAYQRALQENAQLRAERAKAEKAVHYDGTKTQAEHEAGLIGSMISLFASKDEFMKKYENADLADPQVMEQYAQDLNRIVDQGLNPLGQIMLRNTDPAHNTRDEKMRQADGAAPAPVLEAAPAPTPATAPDAAPAAAGTREPAPAPTLAP